MLRSSVRQRARLTQDRSRSVQHLQKALTEMNVQLDAVLSDIMGKTGQKSCAPWVPVNTTARAWRLTGTGASKPMPTPLPEVCAAPGERSICLP